MEATESANSLTIDGYVIQPTFEKTEAASPVREYFSVDSDLAEFGTIAGVVFVCAYLLTRAPQLYRRRAKQRASQSVIASRSSATSASAWGSIRLSSVGLIAIFWDCYWNELDSYAAYLWDAISPEERSMLWQADPILLKYVSHVVGMEPQDLGFDKDPAYAAPLPLNHLDQNTLTRWVKLCPEAQRYLSRIRRHGLKLTGVERVRLRSPRAAAGTPDPSELIRLPRSTPRVLKNASFYELLCLPKQSAQEILKVYSAQELASAWIGPDVVLEQVEALLPEKKRAQLRERLSSVKADRNSPVFHGLSLALQKSLR